MNHSGLNESTAWRVDDTRLSLNCGRLDRAVYAAALESAYSVNRPLFSTAPAAVRVDIVSTEQEWSNAAECYAHLTFAWGVTLDDGRIVVKAPEFAGIEVDRFQRVLAHEMNHSFWVQNFGRRGAGWTPNWIVEGLANLAAAARELFDESDLGPRLRAVSSPSELLEFEYRDLNGPEELRTCYSLWRIAVSGLCPRGDMSGLMACLDRFCAAPSKQGFETAFADQFRITLDEYALNLLQRLSVSA